VKKFCFVGSILSPKECQNIQKLEVLGHFMGNIPLNPTLKLIMSKVWAKADFS